MRYYEVKDKEHIVCQLCRHHCTIKEGNGGICGININKNQKLINTVHSHPSAINLDPIEKKPLYHFLPTSKSFSIGTVGCNFRCPFCQNCSISQISDVDSSIVLTPKDALKLAKEYNAKSISYTYNEPSIWYPYAKDIGLLAKKEGLKNVFVSNGYESKSMIEDMQEWVDAINIDLKSFSHHYYKTTLKASLDDVLDTLVMVSKTDIWLEVTTLLIPGVNDSKDEINKMAEFIKCNLGKNTPWHLSAFYSAYKMQDTKNTPLKTLLDAKEIAKKHSINYIYIGNIPNDNSTYCPQCDALLIKRENFNTKVVNLKGCVCEKCGYKIAGRFL